jgi:hypothetical protein
VSATADQHRLMGKIYDYPTCCVEAFVSSREVDQAQRRGIVYRPDRSPEEVARLDAELGRLFGFPHEGSPKNQYVPCEACIGSPGWRPFSAPRPPAIVRWRALNASVAS